MVTANETIQAMIGQLVVQNAALAEQVEKLQAEIEKLKKDKK